MAVRIMVSAAVVVVGLWFVLAIAVWIIGRPSRTSFGDVARLLPDVVWLMWSLARDSSTPRGVRWRLIFDFVPVIGFADNFAVTTWALRSAVRRAGPEVVARHWRGSPEELALLYRVGRLGPAQ
jgi:Protein of unknown function (DUF1232)